MIAVKSKLPPRSGSCLEAVEAHPHKGAIKFLSFFTGNKKDQISLGDHQTYLQVFQDFTKHRKKTNRVLVFTCRPFPNILKYMDQ